MNYYISKKAEIYELVNNFQYLSHEFQGETQLLQISHNNLIYKIKLNLIGKIQLKNVQMAIAAAIKSDIDIKKILKVIPKIKSVEGRFEKIGKIKNHDANSLTALIENELHTKIVRTNNHYHNLKNIEKIPQTKRRETLMANKDKAILSKQLVTLKDDVELPISIDDLSFKPLNIDKLVNFLDEMEFSRIKNQIINKYGAANTSSPKVPEAKEDNNVIIEFIFVFVF